MESELLALARSLALAKAILVPFESIPLTIDELQDALNSKLLWKLPVTTHFWDELKRDEAAKEIFELESLTPP